MAAISKALLETALTLDPDERAQLANKILASLHQEEDGVEQAWSEEITRRAREVREGRAELVDGPSSLRAIRERLQRP
jgi:putative addiction module component (TIGR02574 family)